ncbi:MAG TPA: energy transducer TonB [Leptospiraceae bacterium]|nr:energy transducer TonB [Leptospiraceae bacterium]HMW03799.1 energy transducer TonB [Leptospiraceae bacterium]HMX34804.1 energy transducer TonB [Leptospiraceae bacterium]HMY29779.1 energy transducer TonB [Leptospiraceae bacterium]HMZ62822.1 energy transducer TonB [Leptospiraceae bacterium]
MLFLSIFIHFSVYAAYYISTIINIEEVDSDNIKQDMDVNFEEIPPELIGGTSSPAPVEKSEWVEGSNKNADDPIDEDISVNAVSGNGTDKDGYLFSFNGDKVPTPIIDFDLKQFFPAAAKAANITDKTVVVLVQIDETGALKSAKIASGKAGYGFDEAAIKIINMARFSPGYVKGKPVKMSHRVPINFTLDE